MVLDKDFKEFIELLNAHKVDYLVIGGYAVNFHGYPRYTKDIDFWIWLTKDNINRLLVAINEFGFGSLGLQADDLLNPDNVVQLGYEPYRIDLLTDVKGVDFQDCFQRKATVTVDHIQVNFLSLEDLIQAKRKAGRLQDLADAQQLEKIKKKKNKNTKGKRKNDT
jgi:predicted nucleotidyltransferase